MEIVRHGILAFFTFMHAIILCCHKFLCCLNMLKRANQLKRQVNTRFICLFGELYLIKLNFIVLILLFY